MDNNHNFFSVSADGRVVSWTLVKVSHENTAYLLKNISPLKLCLLMSRIYNDAAVHCTHLLKFIVVE